MKKPSLCMLPGWSGFGVSSLGVLAGLAVAAPCAGRASEPPRGCFRTVAEAVGHIATVDLEQMGSGSGLGFRVEDRRHDALLNRNWATVRSCEHPERPALTVDAGAAGGRPGNPAGDPAGSSPRPAKGLDERAPEFSLGQPAMSEAVKPEALSLAPQPHTFVYVPPIVLAGTQIRVVRTEANLRFDTAGIAQSSGAVGDRIRVRLVRATESNGEPEQFLTAIVRSAEVLEMEP